MRSYPLLLNRDSFGGAGILWPAAAPLVQTWGRTDLGYTGQTKDQRPVSESPGRQVAATGFCRTLHLVMWRSGPLKRIGQGVVTVGMGGNDIGFADIILRCVSPLNKVWKPEVNGQTATQHRRTDWSSNGP